MSSMVCSQYVIKSGSEPILHLTTRDRNRIAIQSELYGAFALGVRNILFMAGDHARFGTHPDTKIVHDLNTQEVISLAKNLSRGVDHAGEELEGIPEFYLGATINPNIGPMWEQVRRTREKKNAGAEFFQTQAIFNPSCLEEFMNLVDYDLKVLVGIIPLRDYDMAVFLNENVPGIDVPDEFIRRLADAGMGLDEEARSDAMKAEGIQIALETISQVREIDGINGLHLMGVGWPESIVELVKGAELYPRPKK